MLIIAFYKLGINIAYFKVYPKIRSGSVLRAKYS